MKHIEDVGRRLTARDYERAVERGCKPCIVAFLRNHIRPTQLVVDMAAARGERDILALFLERGFIPSRRGIELAIEAGKARTVALMGSHGLLTQYGQRLKEFHTQRHHKDT